MFSSLERPTPHAGKTLPQLDALRGIAILGVFTQHLGDRFLPLVRTAIEAHAPPAVVPWVLTTLHHAWWGVDLFFVSSGFSLALSWIRSGGQSTTAFFLRRAARILPGYYVALAITLVCHRALVFQEDFATALFVHSLVLQGYLPVGGIVIIGATWSLTTEISFYLLFPGLARLVSSSKLRLVLFACTLVFVSWFVRSILHDRCLEPGIFAGMLEATQRRWIVSRLDQFLLGALAARVFVLLEHSTRAARVSPVVLGLCVPALIGAFKLEGAYYFERGGSHAYALLSLVTTLIVLSACLCRGRHLALIAPKPLVFTGVVSYGMFLYHQLALGLCDFEPSSPPSWTNLARTSTVALGLSLLLGYASWVLVEKPVMRWASTISRRPSRVRASTRPCE